MKIHHYPKPIRAKVGYWDGALEYDAETKSDGLVWLRVHGGFSGQHDREDWVLLIPALSIAVTRHHKRLASEPQGKPWRGGQSNFATREEAMRDAARHGLQSAYFTLTKQTRELHALATAMHMIERCDA